MIEPKKSFQKDSRKSKTWADTVDSPLFHEAATAATAQLVVNFGAPPEMATAAANAWRLEGAKMMLHALMTLATPIETKPKPARNDNLRPV